MIYNLRWSIESVNNLEEILDYLKHKWNEREVENFKEKLNHHLDLILKNPFMFPISQMRPRLRKAVLSKQTTIFYEIQEKTVYLTYLHINKKSIKKIR